MPKGVVKQRKGENLTDPNVDKVIRLLEDENPITKKEACGILNIKYNTKRLNTIIENRKRKAAVEKKRRKELRGKPVTVREEKDIIMSYIHKESLSSISKHTFRPISVIERVLGKYSVPKIKKSKKDHKPELLPDGSIKEDYNPGDLVFSAKYNSVCEINKLFQESKNHGKVYSLWVLGPRQRRVYQPYYELGDLTFLKELGVSKTELKSIEDSEEEENG